MSRAFAEIRPSAITTNARTLGALAPESELCAVVKADGYGHGAEMAAAAALAGGANRLGIAQVAEGVRLREAGFECPIWLFSEPDPAQFADCVRFHLEPPIYTGRGLEAAKAAAVNGGLMVHGMVDTGMHRIGVAPESAVGFMVRILAEKHLVLGSVWTHLAVADEPGNPYTDVQLDLFDTVLDELTGAGVEVPLVHAANSAATMAVPRAHFDVVRPGVSLYGMSPSPALEGTVPLHPALKLWTTISHVQKLRAGDRISYGLRTTLERDTVVATLPIGYADGVPRRWWQEGWVLVHGQRCGILGVVTMDQMMVDVTDVEPALGDRAVLLGAQGTERISPSDWAAALGTINYEITCGIGKRVERIVVG